jgi:hypothetical protein
MISQLSLLADGVVGEPVIGTPPKPQPVRKQAAVKRLPNRHLLAALPIFGTLRFNSVQHFPVLNLPLIAWSR